MNPSCQIKLSYSSFPHKKHPACLSASVTRVSPSLFPQPPFYSRNTAEMYDNILNKPLQLKPNITNSARHLLEGLLQKDRTKRLGAKEDFVSAKLAGACRQHRRMTRPYCLH